MKNSILFFAGILLSFGLGVYSKSETVRTNQKLTSSPSTIDHVDQLKLGAFSVSLSVKDLNVSKQFYENLGFTAFGGDVAQNYVIMKNGTTLIGLFQGFFTGNMLTFNPGWNENKELVDPFDDVRTIQEQLKSKNIPLSLEADKSTTGPAYVMLSDPDGNVILIDQHR